MTDSRLLDPDRLAPDADDPTVSEVMRQEVVFCLPSTPIDAIAKLLSDNDLGEIPVLIDRRPVGYVASRDVVARYVEGDVELGGSDVVRPQPTSVQARDVLRTPPLLVDERSRLGAVVALMHQQRRTVALVTHDDESPVGMLTVRELAAHAARRLAAAGRGADG
jgi:CBS domain-containing protein